MVCILYITPHSSFYPPTPQPPAEGSILLCLTMSETLAIGIAAATFFLLGASISLAYIRLRWRRNGPDDLERRTQSAKVADGPESADPEPTTTKDATVRRFGWPEIESLTANFSPTAIIGQGGFSTVYLARLPPSAAIKAHRSSERLHRAFRQELDALLRLRHPNIVRLLGYCDDPYNDGGALVLEHVPGGTLHDRLHGGGYDAPSTLPWARRMSIALRLAGAVEYLHEGCDPQVVHGDIKAANVLLDGDADPKLCDFGSARMGFSAAVRSSAAEKPTMTGSPGYVDPHYLRSGMVSKKSDVYSFGVVLLELVTGERAFCSETELPLAAAVFKKGRTGEAAALVDPRLGKEYDAEEAAVTVELAVGCVGEHPSLRPTMAEVIRVMKERVPSAAAGKGGSGWKAGS